MPTFKADLKAAQDSGTVRQRLDANLSNQDVRRFIATHTVLATEAANDTIDFFDLPVGAIFLPELSRIVSDGAGGTGVTFSKFGDIAVDNRYSTSAMALTAAGIVAFTPIGANLLAPFKVTSGNGQTLRGTLTGTLPMTVGKKIALLGYYTLP